MSKKKSEKKSIKFTITIGPLLKEILDEQKNKVDYATYNCVKSSYAEVGEIIAKKIKESKIL